ncbi:MAG: oxygen-independent coproporphyrinogen III oxidase [Pedobacter sp.]|uniref:oxygen-independent coproporphyrinogen III oxidase n=1 Tax=Pedobacter sp. TaxID=1411316 RepID=UPI002807CF7E|nr:oxygen-independent coproporphyrinogen III oxidase [Pedobacter sp.]MDQ8004160.1 oxygen-independent coproporphyrinogen III oxidase [Pedobacter sp.]
MEAAELLRKYNIAAPRYTSYPTVPYWDNENFSATQWKRRLVTAYGEHKDEGISLYIHLPFCESLCTYCGCNTRITKNHGVELPYIDALLKEWEMYCALLGERPKIKEIHLGGGTPTFFSADNLKQLLETIAGASKFNDDAACSFEGHPDNTTADHLQVLYNLGFKRVSFGIQDFDPKVQFMINRYQTPEQVLKITELARSIGYQSINYDLIYGLPGQNMGGLIETINEVIALKPDRIAFYSYAHVPWIKAGQRHFTEKDIPQGDEKFALYQQGREMLVAAGYEEIGMDHFALKTDSLYIASEEGKLHRNFMGYTDQHTHILLGLGVSSISDCGTAFAQNAKTVEEYKKFILSDELAVQKGHLLSEEDLRIRRQILDLMCQSETCFVDDIPAAVVERLQPMIADRLVAIRNKEVKILPLGKSFLRNVCMAFDERLWQQQPKTQLFSAAI